ncbi:MAG: hypothetical protein WCO44_05845 [Bacteroidota bacterium]
MSIDQFEQYYTEKLWEAIPSIYRHEDGMADKPGVLRAIVSVMAKQAAILRRSQDRLWDDQFIELCDEWAVPYIGDLVATRLLSALNPRGRRVDVAKTIYYRRRKGTPRILEELINDISGWEGKMTEQFTKLARSRHGLDPFPAPLAGRYTGTMPGGWADLRNQKQSELANGPFEEFFHTPDVRRYSGIDGRYAIPKLAFYLYRLTSFEAVNITPFSMGDGKRFGFDPSGREIPLFSQSGTSRDWNQWHSPSMAELPAPIPCRLLGNAEYLITGDVIQQLKPVGLTNPTAWQELGKIAGLRFKNEASLLAFISTFSTKGDILLVLPSLLAFSLVADCGKSILLPDEHTVVSAPLDLNSIAVCFRSPDRIITTRDIAAASLVSWSGASDRELSIDAEKGLFMFQNDQSGKGELIVSYHYGFSAPLGAGTYERPCISDSLPAVNISNGGALIAAQLPVGGAAQIDDSRSYGPVDPVTGIKSMVLQSESSQRPYIRIEEDWTLSSGSEINSSLTLDGLWIGAKGGSNLKIILEGDFDCVVIRNCTLDPGGSSNIAKEVLFPVSLSIRGRVGKLCIGSSILGPVYREGSGIVEEMSVSDSIIQSVDPLVKALNIDTGKSVITRTTVFGESRLHRLEASEALFTGTVMVTDSQQGCFRFSAAPETSRLPHPYESFLFARDSNHWFTSRRFGDPGYGQLSDTAPEKLKRGAENGSETGAFSSMLNPVKSDGLQSKVSEYMPFGLIPIFIHQT